MAAAGAAFDRACEVDAQPIRVAAQARGPEIRIDRTQRLDIGLGARPDVDRIERGEPGAVRGREVAAVRRIDAEGGRQRGATRPRGIGHRRGRQRGRGPGRRSRRCRRIRPRRRRRCIRPGRIGRLVGLRCESRLARRRGAEHCRRGRRRRSPIAGDDRTQPRQHDADEAQAEEPGEPKHQPVAPVGRGRRRRRLRRERGWARWSGWRPRGRRSSPLHQPLDHRLLVARRHDVLAWLGYARRSPAAANPTHDRRKGTPGMTPPRIRGSANPAAMRKPASGLAEPRLVVPPEGSGPPMPSLGPARTLQDGSPLMP